MPILPIEKQLHEIVSVKILPRETTGILYSVRGGVVDIQIVSQGIWGPETLSESYWWESSSFLHFCVLRVLKYQNDTVGKMFHSQ